MDDTGRRASFWIGLGAGVVLAAVVLFSVFYIPRKGIDPFRESLTLDVLFLNAHGLHVGDAALLNGLEVGEVNALEVRDIPELGVRCVATVEIFDREAYGDLLRYDSVFTIGGEGLLGRRAVDIIAGGVAAPLAPGAVVVGTEPFDPMTILHDAQAVAAELRSLLAGDEPGSPNIRRALKNLEVAIRNLRTLTDKLR